MLNYITFAIVIILLVTLIYYAFYYNSDRRRRRRAAALLQNSSGTNDANAQAALEELRRIRNPTAADHFRHARALRFNVLEDDLHRTTGEERAATMRDMIHGYTNTLMNITNDQDTVVDYTVAYIVDDIENFRHQLLMLDDDIDDDMLDIMYNFNHIVDTHVPVVRQNITQDIVTTAVETASTKAEAIEKCFDSATNFTNDAQNVHDTSVNNDLRNTLQRLKSTVGGVNPSQAISEARAYIQNEYLNDPANSRRNAQNALAVLDTIRKGGIIHTFNEREDNIFAYAWERCKHPSNRGNMRLMRDALVTALADSIENGAQVCINGRCGRILNSFATLDFDDTVASGALTYEAYKNQIYQETKEIMNDAINRAKKSSDPLMRAVGESYETGDDADPETEEIFKAEVKRAIDNNMSQYLGKLTQEEIHKITQECYIYAMII